MMSMKISVHLDDDRYVLFNRSAILGLNLEVNRIAIDSIIPISIDLNVSLNGNG